MREIDRAHVIVSGAVQGVLFRSNARDMAEHYGLTGWIKNRWDGSVEAYVEGEKSDIDKIISWFYKGPPSARVDKVEVVWEKATGEFDGFAVKY
ncbi:MAG: acylphosphatase [Candidatus Omnitrophica bacterium]|nr:acylphosphatase [Candidatus Omnitrophota bacterium]